MIVDLHWSDADQPMIAAAQHCAPDRDSLTFWRELATLERGDRGMWFEFYNDPHDVSWAQWRDGGAITCSGQAHQAAGMQSLLDAVRGTGATNIVLAGGLDWAYDLSGAVAEHLVGVNVAYATHPSAGKGGGAADWPRAFGDVARTVPVVATEFGRTDCAASSPYDNRSSTTCRPTASATPRGRGSPAGAASPRCSTVRRSARSVRSPCRPSRRWLTGAPRSPCSPTRRPPADRAP